ncbi:hypothetical protein ACFV97_01395 [Streptomyces sp. NPDC059913]|uniref:hypothetical protein n=1 Tax=unclassified Streptomyces TaxID=2593676 RepID=UPI003658C339
MSDADACAGADGGACAGVSAGVRSGAGADGGAGAPVALDVPETALGLERYRGTAWRWVAAGMAWVVACVLLAVFVDGPFLGVLPEAVGCGLAAALTGVLVRRRARRMRRVLEARPWQARSSVAVMSGMSGAAVVLGGGGSADELLPLRPLTAQWRFPLLSGPAGVLWWCGDPRTGGVLAPPGGGQLLWAGPLRGRRARALVARPEVDALRTRPVPVAPQVSIGGADGDGNGNAGAGVREADLRHSVLAAMAERHSELRGPDRPGSGAKAEAGAKREPGGALPAGPDRPVTWWRVRALRRLSKLGRAAWPLAYTALIVVLYGVMGADTVSGPAAALALLSGPAGIYLGWRTLRSGIPLARRVGRAATAPESRTRRYVLLSDRHGAEAGPLLLVFPAEEGDVLPAGEGDAGGDDLPEGMLRLLPPGSEKRPWEGLPAPTGTVRLRGWIDGVPLVVAWIEGQPYWPQTPYEAIDPSDPAALRAVAEMLPGPM